MLLLVKLSWHHHVTHRGPKQFVLLVHTVREASVKRWIYLTLHEELISPPAPLLNISLKINEKNKQTTWNNPLKAVGSRVINIHSINQGIIQTHVIYNLTDTRGTGSQKTFFQKKFLLQKQNSIYDMIITLFIIILQLITMWIQQDEGHHADLSLNMQLLWTSFHRRTWLDNPSTSATWDSNWAREVFWYRERKWVKIQFKALLTRKTSFHWQRNWMCLISLWVTHMKSTRVKVFKYLMKNALKYQSISK